MFRVRNQTYGENLNVFYDYVSLQSSASYSVIKTKHGAYNPLRVTLSSKQNTELTILCLLLCHQNKTRRLQFSACYFVIKTKHGAYNSLRVALSSKALCKQSVES
jgi:hypothetical protein